MVWGRQVCVGATELQRTMQRKAERLARNHETGSENSVICAKGMRD